MYTYTWFKSGVIQLKKMPLHRSLNTDYFKGPFFARKNNYINMTQKENSCVLKSDLKFKITIYIFNIYIMLTLHRQKYSFLTIL